MAQFLPTFTPDNSKEKSGFTASTEDELDEIDLPESLENEYQFIFIVDRSGSMGNYNRMDITVDALKLFMQSLPNKSKFGIISFGSRAEWY